METLWLLISFLSGVTLASLGWLWRQKTLKEKILGLNQELEEKRTRLFETEKALLVAEEKIRLLEEQGREKEELWQRQVERLEEAFKANAYQILEETRRGLLLAAEEKFKDKEAALSALLKPLQEALSRLDQEVKRLEKEREGAYQRLDEQLRSLVAEHLPRLEEETKRLAQALRDPGVRGRWGEIQLRRVLEWTGMLPHCDFLEQVDLEGARPDLVIRFPGGRVLAIDAKAPLKAYLEGLEKEELVSYVSALKGHIKTLAAKEYWSRLQRHLGRSPELVVLFLPAEPLLLAALEQEPDLFEFAVRNRVVLATPMTLVALLKAVALSFREEALAQNALEIAKLGRELYERLLNMGQRLESLGQSLKKTVDQYDQLVGSWERRVLVSARRLKDFGAGGEKELPLPKPLSKIPRKPQA